MAPRLKRKNVVHYHCTCRSSVEHPFGSLATGELFENTTAHDFASQPYDWFAFIEDAEAQQANKLVRRNQVGESLDEVGIRRGYGHALPRLESHVTVISRQITLTPFDHAIETYYAR